MTALATRNLSKDFGGLHAVSEVSFEVEPGEIRALIGPNGAGKTTLVGLISGRLAPSRGTVHFDGRDITTLPAHKRIAAGMAYTFQITSVFGRLSVRENVGLAVRRARPRVPEGPHVDAALDRVGLTGQADQIAGDLAYGHQRLLEIAMGLAQDPKLLILDEPTQGLAAADIAAFKTLMSDLRGQTTVLLIEHNMDVVMEVADTITVLNFGTLLAEGTPTEIRANKAVQAAYLGGDA
ncbi:MAG: ABC transporter ATP-binding protein [Pseudomonadota bacterium]